MTLALQRISTDHNDLISIEVRRYMRDVLDHNIQASDRITSYDEMLSSLVQAALGKVAMQQNVDMRKISAWVAIAAVPTALAGIYGMNFEHMPELQWTWGYPAVLIADVLRLLPAVPDVPSQPLALNSAGAGVCDVAHSTDRLLNPRCEFAVSYPRSRTPGNSKDVVEATPTTELLLTRRP